MAESVTSQLVRQLLKPDFLRFDSVIQDDEAVGSVEVQAVDGGFFERFGSLLQVGDGSRDSNPPAASGDGGPEGGPLTDLPAESSPAKDEEVLLDAVGWNIEELYEDMLYMLHHNVGTKDSLTSDRLALCSLLKDAFKIDQAKHQLLSVAAEAKKPPKIIVNAEVIQAQDLKLKDNGICNPFCTLYLSSSDTHRYNTAVKPQTLNPIWDDHFSLPVQNVHEDVLCVEVWDFNCIFSEEKKGWALRKLMDMAALAATGKNGKEPIGTVQVPLRGIEAEGQMLWLELEKNKKSKKRGFIKLRLAFSAEKNDRVARQDHRHLLRLLLLHHLESHKLEPYVWDGVFDNLATSIIRRHSIQSGLLEREEALVCWVEYCTVHTDHPLSFAVFVHLVNKLQKPMADGYFSSEEVKDFWNATKKLLPSCLNILRKFRMSLNYLHRITLQQFSDIVSVLRSLRSYNVPEDADLFPASIYSWLSKPPEQARYDLNEILEETVRHGAAVWITWVQEQNIIQDNSKSNKLKSIFELVQRMRSDLQMAVDYHDNIFATGFSLRYSSLLYRVYAENICEQAQPIVQEATEQIIKFRFDDNEAMDKEKRLSIVETLCELYLALQRLSELGKAVCPIDLDPLRGCTFHEWFLQVVTQWLDTAHLKALERVKMAVEIDDLNPVHEKLDYTFSAVDTYNIFFQIGKFWKQLDWPNIEDSYNFVAKIIDDMSIYIVFYADKFSEKVDGLGDRNHVGVFQVTPEWCLLINNIDHLRQSILPFGADLRKNIVRKPLQKFQSSSTAQQCRKLLLQIIDQSIDTVKNKIDDLLLMAANKMEPTIKYFLEEAASEPKYNHKSMDRLTDYLNDNLEVLHSKLDHTNFVTIWSFIWNRVSSIILDLVETSLEESKPPQYYTNLRDILHSLTIFFKHDHFQQQFQEQQRLNNINSLVLEASMDSFRNNEEKLKVSGSLLQFHGLETETLICQFYTQRLEDQRAIESDVGAPHQGLLTIRAVFHDDFLRVEILNARNIKFARPGICYPYVKVRLLPEEKFAKTGKKIRTKTHKRDVALIFDETFDIYVTPDKRGHGGIINFALKGKTIRGSDFIGEAFVPFEEVPTTIPDLLQSPQVHLKLNKPQNISDSMEMKVLDGRKTDKVAKDFVRRQRKRAAKNNTKFYIKLDE